jgi:uncharacterized surface protein with fasciclin (FAS1) repeats
MRLRKLPLDGKPLKNKMRKLTQLLLVAAALAVLAPTTLAAPAHKHEPSDIVDTAVAAGSVKTRVAAVQAADLVDALKGTGPFTVFAPTDEAFKKLPSGTLSMLLKPENKAKLKAILLYHVLSGKYTAADVLKLKSGTLVKTLDQKSVKIRHNSHGVRVNNAHVVKADIECTNGVIHVIDTVLIPN